MDTVEKLVNRLPEEQSELACRIRDLVMAAHPEVTEQLHFSTPFFSCRGWLCYFDIPHGPGFEVGFPKGHLLDDPHGLLIARNRKLVRSLSYPGMESFKEDIFLEYLQQALALNLQKKKNPGKNRTSNA